MRIISGSYKGKKIIAPKNLPIRPTTDFAKEGLFNFLNNHFHFSEISVLDLFCGSGNISYEFLSRGSKNIVCVDQSSACIKFVHKTAQILYPHSIKTIKSDCLNYLKKCNDNFDIIFADPPYNYKQYDELIALANNMSIIKPNGMFIVEHDSKLNLDQANPFDVRKYGNVCFSIFKH